MKSKFVEKSVFGKKDETVVYAYTLKNKNNIKAKIITYGATLVNLIVPDKKGNFDDIVLGYENLDGYINDTAYMGCIVGRVANRIANAKFTLDGKIYQVSKNHGIHHLHGGFNGFNKKIWAALELERGVQLSCTSNDGEEGFCGTVTTTVTYILNDQNELKIQYSASTDKKTPINLTNHSYFNLAGSGTILNHDLQIFATHYTKVDKDLIPTGEIESVKDSALDFFSKPETIGKKIPLEGYDVNYCLKKVQPDDCELAARITEKQSGRIMEVLTTKPGLQFYSGNYLDIPKGKGGKEYKKFYGLCLECQHFPDSINHPEFPSTILEPGKEYKQTTIYRFLIVK